MGISKINKNNIVGHNSDSINGILTPIIFREVLFTRFNLRDLNPASATKKVAKSHNKGDGDLSGFNTRTKSGQIFTYALVV